MSGREVRRATLLALAATLSVATPSRALAASPGQPAADRGAARYRAGDVEGAGEAFREAIRLDPGLANAWQSLGWVEHRLGHDDEALRIWSDLLRLYPERADTREAIAAVRRERERRGRSSGPAAPPPLAPGEESLPTPPEADAPGLEGPAVVEEPPSPGPPGSEVAGEPRAPPAAGDGRELIRLETDRGAAAFAAGEFDAAAEAFARAVALDGGARLALRGLGWAHRKAGRPAEAERAWKEYAAAFPGLAEPHDLLAGLYLERHAYADALVEARASLALDPAPTGAQLRHIRSLFGLGRIRDARAAAAALAERAPDDPLAQRAYADALTKSLEFREAARQWRRVLDLAPGSAPATQNWLRALYEAGEADAAVEGARRIATSPDAPAKVLELLAEDGKARGDLDEAARWYRELTRRFPGQLSYWRSLLQVLDALGRFDEQVAAAREGVRRLPSRSELQLDLATALGNAGELREAIALTRRHLQAFPDSRAAYAALVDLLARSGDVAAALDLLARSQPTFYKGYERTLVEASLRERQNELSRAKRLLHTIVEAGTERRFVPILLYHGVVAHPRTLQTSVAAFDAQMGALASRGYRAITLTELTRMIGGAEPFPERPILITFDDARTDSFRAGDPILEKYGFKATMFVPTANVGLDDAFHAGWDTIQRYVATGRWDLQAHGHEAHVPVTIDAAGDRGEFLIYRAWRPDGRLEDIPEFLARVDGDFRACKRALEEHVPGHEVVGYAYPLNQVAYAGPPAGVLAGVNERFAARYFRFGLVQDGSGYNELARGAEAPFMLRRFEVPGEWRGDQLLAHLARQEPHRAARLELARITLEEGRPQAARRMLEEIVRDEPLVAPDAEVTFAYVASEEQRPREAAAHLAAGAPPPPDEPHQADTFANRLAWRNDPRAGAETSAFTDSDGRAVLRVGAAFRRPLVDQLDLALDAAQLRLSERGLPALEGPQLTAGVSGALGERVELSSWLRLRRLGDAGWGANGGALLQLREEQHVLSFQWLYEDVDTVRAELRGIQRHYGGVGYAFASPEWEADARAGRFQFDDGNGRNDLHLRVLRVLGGRARWGFGASVDLEDSRFAPPEYYAPQRLAVATGLVRYSRRWRDSSALGLTAGLGVAHDTPHGARPSGLVSASLSRWWGTHHRLATALGVEARAVPGYRSVEATFRLEGRF
jgi:tetratricopeptide (TPR) repeat protein